MIDIEVEDEAWTAALPDVEVLTLAAATAALRGEAHAITILLTDDETVRDLNNRFRGKDSATNVLSFPAPENPEKHLGDIALASGVCAREAVVQGKTIGAHLQHLTVHGVLHLLGYDHMSEDEAEDMESLERVVLVGLGVSDPYSVGEGDHD